MGHDKSENKKLLIKAVKLHRDGALEQALDIYENILANQPHDPATLHNAGIVCIQKGMVQKGIKLLLSALRLQPENGQYWINCIKAIYHTGDVHGAYRLLKKGRQQGLSGNVVDQLAHRIEQACEQRPDIPLLASLNAACDYSRLEQAVREQMEHFGALPELQQMLGVAFVGQGRLKEALELFEPLCKVIVDNAQLWNYYAVTLQRMGRLAEADVAYKKALACAPENHVILYNLGGNLKDQGRYEEALPYLQRAFSIAPQSVAARLNLANTLAHLGRFDEALSFAESVIKEKPERTDALLTYGKILCWAEKTDQAIEPLRNALILRPDDCQIILLLAYALARNRQSDEAFRLYKRACDLLPDRPGPWVELAGFYINEGEFVAAEDACKRALLLDPEYPDALAKLARVRKMHASSDAWWLARVQSLLKRKKVTPEEEMNLRYSMGKYGDDTGNYSFAFKNYQYANKIKSRFCKVYSLDEHKQLTDKLMAVYTAEHCARILPGASISRLPVLIVGMPRSGTSLMEQIMASHPQICGVGELDFWKRQVANYKNIVLAGKYPPEILKKIASNYLSQLEKYCPYAVRVVDKFPGNFLNLGIFHSVFPYGRIIHAVRNPIDTCLSIYFQNFHYGHSYANDLNDLADYYRQYHRLMNHWRKVLPPDIFFEVPYDALVEDQEGWSRKIIEFLRLPWDDRCLEFYKTKRQVGTASNWQVRQKIYKTSKERWRNYKKYITPLLPLLELWSEKDV